MSLSGLHQLQGVGGSYLSAVATRLDALFNARNDILNIVGIVFHLPSLISFFSSSGLALMFEVFSSRGSSVVLIMKWSYQYVDLIAICSFWRSSL